MACLRPLRASRLRAFGMCMCMHVCVHVYACVYACVSYGLNVVIFRRNWGRIRVDFNQNRARSKWREGHVDYRFVFWRHSLRRLSHTAILTVNLTLTRTSGAALIYVDLVSDPAYAGTRASSTSVVPADPPLISMAVPSIRPSRTVPQPSSSHAPTRHGSNHEGDGDGGRGHDGRVTGEPVQNVVVNGAEARDQGESSSARASHCVCVCVSVCLCVH